MRDINGNVVLLHPGAEGNPQIGAAIAYTVPKDGDYLIEGAFARANNFKNAGDGVEVAIFKSGDDNPALYRQAISSAHAVNLNDYFDGSGVAPFRLFQRLTKNDVLRFVVFSGVAKNDGGFDVTALKLKVDLCNVPVVKKNPIDQTVFLNQVATFTSGAGKDSSSVQWQVSADGQTFSDIPGATSLKLSVPATLARNGNRYRAVFNNDCGTATTNAAMLTVLPPLLITKFRFSGPQWGGDWFVELYNTTNAPLSIAGYQLGFLEDGTGSFISMPLPAKGKIPARGAYLVAGPNYSLLELAAPDLQFLSFSLDSIGGVVVFNGFVDPDNRLDSVTYNSVPFDVGLFTAQFREGSALPPPGATTVEHSWMRKLVNGLPQDTNNNLADFILLSPSRNLINGIAATLGAVSPQSASSPRLVNDAMPVALFDSNASSTSAPNRTRNNSPVPNGILGTLGLRRAFRNDTGAPITKLRFRVVDITNEPSGAEAELRVLNSVDALVNGKHVRGLTLEQPTAQPGGGGLNSTLAVGVITLANPLPVGASVTVEFLLGVMREGSYRFFVNIEAAP
jgi:hypothetical protein